MKLRIWLVITVVGVASFGTGMAVSSRYFAREYATTDLMKGKAEVAVLEKVQAQLQAGDVEGAKSTLKKHIELQHELVATLQDSAQR